MLDGPVLRKVEMPPAPRFSWWKHRTLERYRRDLAAWQRESARRHGDAFDEFCDALSLMEARWREDPDG